MKVNLISFFAFFICIFHSSLSFAQSYDIAIKDVTKNTIPPVISCNTDAEFCYYKVDLQNKDLSIRAYPAENLIRFVFILDGQVLSTYSGKLDFVISMHDTNIATEEVRVFIPHPLMYEDNINGAVYRPHVKEIAELEIFAKRNEKN